MEDANRSRRTRRSALQDEEDDDEKMLSSEEEEEEEEPVEEEDDALDALEAYRLSPTARELNQLEQGALVRVLTTPDVEQRVPHTVNKVGVIEEVPMHPNTWFKVRIRDGDVVYKYRPSALQVLDEGEDISSPAPSPHHSPVQEEKEEEEEVEEEEVEVEEKVAKLEPGARIHLKLGELYIRERYLKKHDGKEGVVTGQAKSGVIVQLDGPENIVLTVRQKHLVVVPDDEEEDEEEEEDEQAEPDEEETKKPAPAKSKRKSKGKLLSNLDPDMWIDRKCRINVGKFKGMHGRVLRSGNGWVQLKLEDSTENTAKRAYELTLLEDMETIKALHAKSLEKEKKRRAEARANGHRRGNADDEDDDDDTASQSGTDDPMAADLTEDSQGEDNGGKRSRRVSTRGNYGISWIEKKVNLPNRKGLGIVKKADRDTCTVEIQNTKVLQVFKKKDLQLVADHAKTARQNSRNRNNAKAREKLGLAEDVVLMGTTPSRYIAFQDLVKRFAMRRREKVKKRPNLIEWEARLNLNYLENGFWDKSNPSVIDLVVVPQCEICGVEKEDINGHCWNNECPRCPAYDVDSFDPKDEDAFMRVPVAPFANGCITNFLRMPKEDPLRKRKRQSPNGTPTAVEGEVADTTHVTDAQITAPESEAKKTKAKKTPSGSADKDAKKSERSTRKKANKADQSDVKRKPVVKKTRSEDDNAAEEEAETGEVSPTSSYRPHYDSVFSR